MANTSNRPCIAIAVLLVAQTKTQSVVRTIRSPFFVSLWNSISMILERDRNLII